MRSSSPEAWLTAVTNRSRPSSAMVTPLPTRPNTAATLSVSSTNASSRSYWAGSTLANLDNVCRNSDWSYTLCVPRLTPPTWRLTAARDRYHQRIVSHRSGATCYAPFYARSSPASPCRGDRIVQTQRPKNRLTSERTRRRRHRSRPGHRCLRGKSPQDRLARMPKSTVTQSIPSDLNALGTIALLTTVLMTTAAAPDDV